MDLEKATGLARVAKGVAALKTERVGRGSRKDHAGDQVRAGSGLREVGIFVNLNKETERAQKLGELHGNVFDENAESTAENPEGSRSLTD